MIYKVPYKKRKSSWNKGLSKETDPRVAAHGIAISRGLNNRPESAKRAHAEAFAVNEMLRQNRFQGTREEAIDFINLNKQYPLHFKHFNRMHNRCNNGYSTISPEFSWTAEGFQNFVDYVGPYPYGMVKPSVGRRNHDLGYIRGNFRWQEAGKNSSEAAVRNNPKRRFGK